MMKRVCIAAMCAALLGGVSAWAWPREAQCATCYSGKCTSSVGCGGSGCVCIKDGSDGIYGRCAAVN